MPRLRFLLAFTFAALSASPFQTAEQRYQAAVELLKQGRPADAQGALQALVAAEPRFAPAWMALGVAHASQGDFPGAEPAFARACSLQPKHPDACFYQGRALYLVNRFTEALTVLAKLSTDRRRYRLEALCHDALGQWKEAEPLYRKAIDQDPGGEDPRIDYAIALARQGRTEEAVPFLELAVQAGRQPPRAALELGRIQLQLNRLSEARTHLERAVALSPESPQAHLLLGRLYARLGMTAEAARQLQLGAKSAGSETKN